MSWSPPSCGSRCGPSGPAAAAVAEVAGDGSLLLTDAARALALYTEDVRNSRLFDDLFAHMLARKLAALIAAPLLKGSSQKAAELEQLYADSLPPARSAAASERSDRPAEDPWLAVR